MAAESATAAPTRVFLVDDHPGLRRGVAACIAEQSDMAVCGEAGTASEALQGIERTKPDVVLTDITLPGRDGLNLIKDIKAMNRRVVVLVLSMHDESLYAERALRAGAQGYVMKSAGMDQLMDAIRQVKAGEIVLGRKVVALMAAKAVGRPAGAASPVDCLSDRELEVFRLLGEGAVRGEIAHRLNLSVKTVEAHRANIRLNLGVRSSVALRQLATEVLREESARPR